MTYDQAIQELQDLVDDCKNNTEPEWAEAWGKVLSAIRAEVERLTRTRDELLSESEAFQLDVRSALGCPDDGVPFVDHIKRLKQIESIHKQYHDAADQAFQACTEIPHPILPHFLCPGDSKIDGIVKLAKAYRDQTAEIIRLQRYEATAKTT